MSYYWFYVHSRYRHEKPLRLPSLTPGTSRRWSYFHHPTTYLHTPTTLASIGHGVQLRGFCARRYLGGVYLRILSCVLRDGNSRYSVSWTSGGLFFYSARLHGTTTYVVVRVRREPPTAPYPSRHSEYIYNLSGQHASTGTVSM